LHTSGCLFDWLAQRHPEYLDLVGELARAGRIEILGGAYHEPILSMIPRRDRRGQIRSYTDRLEERFGRAPLGMWLPERVWEQSLTSDLADCGIEHTVLDDFHFNAAGLAPEELFGYYLTEDDGRLVAVFPNSERLRYAIPFAPPHETIEYLRQVATAHPGGIVVFGDDGEKFGTWPGMKQHVYERGWLTQFFDLLAANSSWLHVTTLAEAVNNVHPLGKIYLPDASYREMGQWSSLADRFNLVPGQREHQPLPHAERGCWRNFRVKYPEADEMYARMLLVSNRLEAARRANQPTSLVSAAQSELYKAQCNCAYWHGTFGGIYLAHLRHAVYQHLIAADGFLDRAEKRSGSWVAASQADFNLDVHKEVALASERFIALVTPDRGGQLYELDVREINHNLLATLAPRPEPYHAQLAAADNGHSGSIECRQPGLAQQLHFENQPRKSLIDHFYDHHVHLDQVSKGEVRELGDFVSGAFESDLVRRSDLIELSLSRQGNAAEHSVRVTKVLTLAAGSKHLNVEYRLNGLPAHHTLHFAVEFNFAIPTHQSNRYFHDGKHKRIGQTGELLDLANRRTFYLVDEHLGVDVGLRFSRSSHVWAFPIHSVSRSEWGLELVNQSVVVMPHWTVQADSQGSWSVAIQMPIDTSLAEARRHKLTSPAPSDLDDSPVPTPHRSRRGRMSIAA
jgi:alpha-amylase